MTKTKTPLLAGYEAARANRQRLLVATNGGETLYHQGFGEYGPNREAAIRYGQESATLRGRQTELA